MVVQANNRHQKKEKKNRNRQTKMNNKSNSNKNDMVEVFFFITLIYFLVTDFPVIKVNNPAHKVSMDFTSISTMDEQQPTTDEWSRQIHTHTLWNKQRQRLNIEVSSICILNLMCFSIELIQVARMRAKKSKWSAIFDFFNQLLWF